MHPLGKSPVITDGNRVVAESGAILEYLEEKYDSEKRLQLTDEEARLQARYWLHYAEGSLMPLLVMKLVFGRLGSAPVPWLLRPVGAALGKGVQKAWLDKQLHVHRQMIEDHLSANPLVCRSTIQHRRCANELSCSGAEPARRLAQCARHAKMVNHRSAARRMATGHSAGR